MLTKKAVKIGMVATLLVMSRLASVMYALVYTQKRELVYDNTTTIGADEVKFRGFYFSSPAVMFEVKITVSEGAIKWTPHSAVMFEDTLGWFPRRIDENTFGKIQRWGVRNRQWNSQMER